MRKYITDEDFPKDKLIVSAIHTHTSLGYTGRTDRPTGAKKTKDLFGSRDILESMIPDKYKYVPLVSDNDPVVLRDDEARAFLIEKIAEAALCAWRSRKEGAYATAFGRAAVGLCRRACYDDGSAKMWGDTNSANFTELEGGNDSGIEMLFTYDGEKKLTGIVANVACPAQVLEHQNFISSDYAGKVKRMIRERYGSDVHFACMISAAGDMCPRDLVRWVDAEIKLNDPNISREVIIERRADPSMFDPKGCEKAARRIATEIFFELEEGRELVTDTTLEHRTELVELPLRRVTPKEYDDAVAAIKSFARDLDSNINYEDNANLMIHSGTIGRFELQKEVNMFDVEAHFVRLGDVAFATNPFELFLDYGNRIRARSLAKQTFLIQLSCGSYGYLPTEKAERGSHYSAFVSSGTAGHEGGDILVRKTLKEINDMFK